MSIQSEIMEEMYDKKIYEFLLLLKKIDEPLTKQQVIDKYLEHFEGYGVYAKRYNHESRD